MEDILQVFDDGTFSYQEAEKSTQVMINNYQLAPIEYNNTSCNNNPHQIFDSIPYGAINTFNQQQPLPFPDNNYAEFNTESQNSQLGQNQAWQHRMRWTDEMVRVLITAASYASHDECESSHQLLSPIKGKWRSISSTMEERGYNVSPQQCEDKFNDLNKKYKRLNDLLGPGLACDVVENPMVMDSMNNISEEGKDEVRKILTCKQLFYKEMCSYHNKNRKFLPHDATIQQSVRSALRISRARYGFHNVDLGIPAKRPRKYSGDYHSNDHGVYVHRAKKELPKLPELPEPPEGLMNSYALELAEKRVRIQNKRLELEKNKLEWLKSCQEEDAELRKMKLENELLRLENKRLALELKCREKRNAEADADAV